MSLTAITSIKRSSMAWPHLSTEVPSSMQVKDVFDDMYQAGLQPSCVTYNTLITAHAHQGNWQAALQVLQHMCRPQVCACSWQARLQQQYAWRHRQQHLQCKLLLCWWLLAAVASRHHTSGVWTARLLNSSMCQAWAAPVLDSVCVAGVGPSCLPLS